MPIPSFEDILNISSSLDPIKLCICLETLSISTSTESILLMTGIISNPASIAAYECAADSMALQSYPRATATASMPFMIPLLCVVALY